jgi:tRNA (adenine57-N1/adenine58-N1)-methyltransferase
MSGELAEGDLVQFLDNKGRRYQAVLTVGKEFHSHSGFVAHTDIIGLPEGSTVRTTRGQAFLVLRPTLSEFILKMPRGAQVIYPKDIGPILMLADLGPGVRVLESGVGSGALSMGMLRAGADIVGYELREDFANRARTNVEQFLGASYSDRYRVELRDCYEGIDEVDLDRVVLDLPEPWQVVPHAAKALRPGGIFVAYTPSVMQVSQLREALHRSKFFAAETVEIMQRGWHVEAQAVRPDHRMVGHTGFLTSARLAG